ncbi:AEC family transporter [Thalassovita aquimarina]|uniref:AEC family transporter n=1 Tax=Thalassovita aquimarina TaxID=2785917 RepID=A0ABS5HQX5_9RHOB|nr:AEC family transporter [Thalassovita aquimarina]MBR9651360.1 AEC family transporter [Thalassovita aquimarina]
MIVGLGLIAPFFLYIIVGVVAQTLLRHSAEQQRWLDAFIFYVALPALLFQSVRIVPPGAYSLLGFLAITTAITGTMFALGWLIGRRNETGDHPAVFGLAASYSNIGYMGPALTVAVLGPEAGAPAAFIFCADVLLIFSIWPLMIGTGARGATRIVQSLRKVLTHPFILATLAGLIFARSGGALPAFIDTPLTGFQNAAAPAALFSLGLTLARSRAGRLEHRLAACLAAKLVGHPLAVALAFTLISGFDPVWVATAIIMGALPPAANVYVMARAEGISVSLSARTVLYGTALSAMTLPVVISLLT